MTNWNRRMQCLVAMVTYVLPAKPREHGQSEAEAIPACPVVWGAVRFHHLLDSARRIIISSFHQIRKKLVEDAPYTNQQPSHSHSNKHFHLLLDRGMTHRGLSPQ